MIHSWMQLVICPYVTAVAAAAAALDNKGSSVFLFVLLVTAEFWAVKKKSGALTDLGFNINI